MKKSKWIHIPKETYPTNDAALARMKQLKGYGDNANFISKFKINGVFYVMFSIRENFKKQCDENNVII